MRPQFLSLAAGIVFVVATTTGAQEAIGPVTPRPAREIDTLEKTLQSLIKADAAGRVWKASDGAKLSEFMERIDEVKGDINTLGVAIGPVTPKPPKPINVTPKPTPPGPKPSKRELDDSLKELLEAVQDARKRDPAVTLPEADAKNLKGIVDTLSKGQLR